jgi:5'-nucleotidase
MFARYSAWAVCGLWLLFLGTGCSTARQIPAATSTAEIRFTILQLNDVYEIAPLEGGKAGGLARVAGLLRQLEAENPNTIAVLAGDFLSPSFIGTLRLESGERVAGQQMIETLNALGLDYATFGNHEFDFRDSSLLRRRLDQSDFAYLSANARWQTDAGLRRFVRRGEPVPDYLVHHFANAQGDSVAVALVGILLPFARQPYLAYLPVDSTFRVAVAQARQRADVVLGLTHLAAEQDLALAKAVPGLPLFMGGHEHEHMLLREGETRVAKADANAKTVYVHRFRYDPGTGELTLDSELVTIDPTVPEDAATRAVVERWQDKVADIMNQMGYDGRQVLMTTTEPLRGKESLVRNEQCNYGQLALRAMEAAWPGADVYLMNSGSLRIDDDLTGDVTAYDVLRSFPYGGPIVRQKLKDSELAQLLQVGLETNRGEGGYLQVRHVKSVPGIWRVGGEALDPDREYTIVLPAFLAGGGENNLEFLEQFPVEERADFAGLKNDLRDLVIAYMQGL